jgi:hypothetical protein
VSKIHIRKMDPKPVFDLMYYLEVSGQTRVEQAILTEMEKAWAGWKQHLNANKLAMSADEDASGYLMVFLAAAVEEEIEASWQKNPALGLALHNLAIAYVMSAAASLVPELAEGACAPLPEPSADMRRAFKRLGLEWKGDGTVTRQYAIFTPHPYSGGCEHCFSKGSCLSRMDITLGKTDGNNHAD